MLTRNSYLANAILGGPAGLVIGILLYVAMAWGAVSLMGSTPLEGSAGVCFPSPNQWALSPYLSFSLSTALTALCVLLAISLNARFTLIPGTGVMYASLYLLAAGSVPWVAPRLSAAIILLTGTLICCHLLFALHGRKNAAQGIFVIFSLLAWGAMIQYAFIMLMPIFMLGAIFIGVFRLREFVAAILGIVAPFWIVTGLGVVSIDRFCLPSLTNLFTGFTDPGPLFFMMLGQSFTALMLLILTASNALVPPTTGQQHRSYIAFINLLGIAMMWFMLFDYTNLLAYSSVMALCLGFQAARYAAIPRHRFAYLPVLISIPAYIAIYILTITQ